MSAVIKPTGATTIAVADEAERHSEVHRSFVVSGLTISDAGGLNAVIATGIAYVSGYRINHPGGNVTLTASATNHIYLLSNGSFSVNTTGVPPANSVKLGQVVTGVSSITSITDQRDLDVHTATQVHTFGSGSTRIRLSDLVGATGKIKGSSVTPSGIEAKSITNADVQNRTRQIWIEAGSWNPVFGAWPDEIDGAEVIVLPDVAAQSGMDFDIVFPENLTANQVTAKIFWYSPPVTGAVQFVLQFLPRSANQDVTVATGSAVNATATVSATANGLVVTTISNIFTGNASLGDIVYKLRLLRDGAALADTLAADAVVLGVLLQYTADS